MTKLYQTVCILSVSAIIFLASGCSSAPKKDAMNMGTPKAPLTYTVEKGDTLSKISRKLNVTVNDLIQTNSINNPNLIKEGTVLVVPE